MADNIKVPKKPDKVHHYATNKNKKYINQFDEITSKYELDLDDVALGNKEAFPELFQKEIKCIINATVILKKKAQLYLLFLKHFGIARYFFEESKDRKSSFVL